jgi:cytoskeletal protein CcmA (bactofilin family)
MGLFGRDDKTPQQKAPAPGSQPAARPTPPTSARAGAQTTVIAVPSHFEGTLTGSAEVTIEGAVKGTVRTEAGVLVAESGTVEAEVHGRSVVVAGTVKGNVTADERIELRPSARLVGNITAPRILIEDGATFEGKVEMKRPPQKDSQQGRKGGPTETSRDGSPSDASKPDGDTRTSSARRDAGNDKGKGKS